MSVLPSKTLCLLAQYTGDSPIFCKRAAGRAIEKVFEIVFQYAGRLIRVFLGGKADGWCE
jgi:hypothetical protein